MRLKSFVVFLFLIVSLSAECQVGIGIMGGPNFSTCAFYKRPDYRSREIQNLRELQFGGFFRYVSEKHAGMQIEFLYAKKGWQDISALENDTVGLKHIRNINYLEVPVMTHFIIGSKKIRIILEGGPYIAYALNSQETFINTFTDEEETENYVWKDGVDNRWDYGLKGSGGFQFHMPFGDIEIKAFYTYGYANNFKDKSEAVETSQNRSFGINFGYIYFFGKKDDNVKSTSTEQ